ncbi:Pycsar system effector family protein [Vibrio sp. ZOR0018]|uniref:Pycsar system effector family protein n=1 Tax=Vibrio sp. ZOR0018 TaxID=1339225 RepID=UPI000646FB53|nr:Pycsar system effector family protein [Vibrio sp. ZOR0018]
MCKDSIEEKLDSVFSNVNDWLKFAEQKNAALLVLNGGIVWGMTRVLSQVDKLALVSYWSSLAGYIVLVCSAIICVISFLPILEEKWFKPDAKKSSDNCFYFADIAKYSKSDYLALLSARLEIDSYKATPYEIDLSSQIVTNAEIALDKYKKFKLASSLTVFAVILFSVSIGFHYF